MRLDDEGRCPACLIEPRKCVRAPYRLCTHCYRTFDLETGELVADWAWTDVDMRLDDEGRCPACLVEPLKYVRAPYCLCTHCYRTFDLETGELVADACSARNEPKIGS